jgi:hypothetical protein
MASDGAWGSLAEHDDELAAQWDGYATIPEPGEHDALDAFCASKGIDHRALVRLGARLSDPLILAYAFTGGAKYRHLETGRRWVSNGAEFTRLKIVPAGAGQADVVIVSESETDACRLIGLFPRCCPAARRRTRGRSGDARWSAAAHGPAPGGRRGRRPR